MCDRRPKVNGGTYCRMCQRELDEAAQGRRQRCDAWRQAWKFLHWNGVVVGLYPVGNDGDWLPMVKPRRLFKELHQLPMSKVIDLDTYIPGFTRQQIKGMKATLKQLAPERKL